jgi:hypothetical protein
MILIRPIAGILDAQLTSSFIVDRANVQLKVYQKIIEAEC